ncbi:uncharacterized protein BT62DRAFT_17713 [Guyanagaster necrorhizus]|uniref:Uncharacterized protein n=1 Tax=Guyanagaster necrorhizus TaxID=856835 RepID=A0A9P7W5P5_9AGAR|nr:uncharacterized protein BT62DRAFT_17713 [Guyanagaster necrorhizus MCA 3950]KAG7452669.1 hypothetical protein BT62DRAFT_17713 [Guyanagaster necrorhizus MCA 3950]
MACAYLLSLDGHLAPSLKRSYRGKERAKMRAEDIRQAMPDSSNDSSATMANTFSHVESPQCKEYHHQLHRPMELCP